MILVRNSGVNLAASGRMPSVPKYFIIFLSIVVKCCFLGRTRVRPSLRGTLRSFRSSLVAYGPKKQHFNHINS